MTRKRICRCLLAAVAAVCFLQACQKDYNKPASLANIRGTRSAVFINSITLLHYPFYMPSGAPWHIVDSTDLTGGPNIYFTITDNTGSKFWQQPSHFGNVGVSDTISYYLTNPFPVQGFGWQFTINYNSWDSISSLDTSYIYFKPMGTVAFTITPGDTLTDPNPYPSYITATNPSGVIVSLGLTWK